MNRLVYPVAYFVVAVGLYFFYISPTWDEVQILREREERFDATLEDAREVENTITELELAYAGITTEDLVRLEKFLPTEIDVTHTIYNVSGIAAEHNVAFESIDVMDLTANQDTPLREYAFSFNLVTSYEVFADIIADIESNLQLANMHDLSIATSLGGGDDSPQGFSQFNISFVMYAYDDTYNDTTDDTSNE